MKPHDASAPSGPLEDHFQRPRNAGVLDGAEIQVRADNPVCGDILQLYLRRKDGRVTECTFQAYGCPAAIAAGSLLTELVQGRSADELRSITRESISRALGGLGSDKVHAAVLGHDALEAALRAWG
ncbi:MAG TPA: iron-sulfur cluster assembly scaffold protein [Planctomycetota bacterium]|nr:iron-sulfur cluster assembly scaffold protein [Planctomycetota bacterium]